MLQKTFIHVPGLGGHTEKSLWQQGCVSWSKYLDEPDRYSVGGCSRTLVKETLLRKSDELSGEVRGFFERLKNSLAAKKIQSFYSKETREQFRMHPMKVSRYLRELESRGYIGRNGGNRKHGFEYEIIAWDEYEKLKSGINILDEILAKLKEPGTRNQDNTPRNLS